MNISLIAAVSENGVIGRNGELPWRLPDDLKHFKQLTEGAAVIMGRLTAESLNWRALPNRLNIVVTSAEPDHTGFAMAHSLGEAVRIASEARDKTFIIGGASIYAAALERALADTLYITVVKAAVEGDVYFPKIDKNVYELISSKAHSRDERNEYDFEFTTWQRKP